MNPHFFTAPFLLLEIGKSPFHIFAPGGKEAHVDTFPDYMREETFTIAGMSFRWMTLRQMEQYTEIQKKNMDVVDMLKHYIICKKADPMGRPFLIRFCA